MAVDNILGPVRYNIPGRDRWTQQRAEEGEGKKGGEREYQN